MSEHGRLSVLAPKVDSLVKDLKSISVAQREGSPLTALTCREAAELIENLWHALRVKSYVDTRQYDGESFIID